jgi:hypothetical protein
MASMKNHFMKKIHEKTGGTEDFSEYLKKQHAKDFSVEVNANSTIANDFKKLCSLYEVKHELDQNVINQLTLHFKYKWF